MLVLVKNSEDTDAPAMPMITTTSASPVSQRSSGPSDARNLSFMAGPSHSQRGGKPDRDEPVQGDGQEQEEAKDRLIPERRDAEYVERGADRVEQQGTQRRSYRAAAPAEDRDPADHHRGDHLKLVAGSRGRVDRAVLSRPQHPGHPGDRAAHGERHEDAPADRDPG